MERKLDLTNVFTGYWRFGKWNREFIEGCSFDGWCNYCNCLINNCRCHLLKKKLVADCNETSYSENTINWKVRVYFLKNTEEFEVMYERKYNESISMPQTTSVPDYFSYMESYQCNEIPLENMKKIHGTLEAIMSVKLIWESRDTNYPIIYLSKDMIIKILHFVYSE